MSMAKYPTPLTIIYHAPSGSQAPDLSLELDGLMIALMIIDERNAGCVIRTDVDGIVQLVDAARALVARRKELALSPVSSTKPSCHACGGPIEIGKPVAIYHANCDSNMR